MTARAVGSSKPPASLAVRRISTDSTTRSDGSARRGLSRTARPKPHSAEKAEGKDRREEAIERDSTDGRKATEGSRGKRRRGGGLNEESSD
jgi:hypothetical protein